MPHGNYGREGAAVSAAVSGFFSSDSGRDPSLSERERRDYFAEIIFINEIWGGIWYSSTQDIAKGIERLVLPVLLCGDCDNAGIYIPLLIKGSRIIVSAATGRSKFVTAPQKITCHYAINIHK